MNEELGFDDPTLIRQMTDEEIKSTFDKLVEAWEDQQTALEEQDAFRRNHIEPEAPATVIESVESLIEYDRQKWRYEERLEAINAALERSNADFQVKASKVKLLLPKNHILIHDYRGRRYELQGHAYTIRHDPPERRTSPRAAKTTSVINVFRRTGSGN